VETTLVRDRNLHPRRLSRLASGCRGSRFWIGVAIDPALAGSV
jgi:hypothetical protein